MAKVGTIQCGPCLPCKTFLLFLCVSLDWYWANTVQNLDSTSPFWLALLHHPRVGKSCSEKEVSLSVLSITMERTKTTILHIQSYSHRGPCLSQPRRVPFLCHSPNSFPHRRLNFMAQTRAWNSSCHQGPVSSPFSYPSLPGWRHRAGEKQGGRVSPALQRK